MCRFRLPRLIALSGLFLAFFASSVAIQAQGVIVPIICERPPRCPVPPRPPRPIIVPQQLPVKSIKIETKINNQVATTHVEQVFRNDTDVTLEGTYFFPIPETASISEFALWENDKRLVGEVRTKEEARRIYESIVRRQRDPGLLEYAGKDLFQATIFPIPPRSDKKLEITYTQVLKAESGTIGYRYPLGTGKNSVPIGTVSGRVEINSNGELRNVYSPSHAIDVRKTSNRTALSFESSRKAEQQDFQLFYTVSNDDFGMSLVTYREPGKDGFFLMTLSPKDALRDTELPAKDIVFVLDTSGSMAEADKMEKARSALLFGVKNLRDADNFNVIGFAGEERLMESRMIQSNAAGRKRGEEFVQSLKATGGTNINDSIVAALKQFKDSDRPKILVFLTDGLPTVGTTDVNQILANVRSNKVENIRIFTFGVGYDVNTRLLDAIAAENGGVAEYVEPKEDLEIKVSNFFAKINSPVLTDLEMDWGGVSADLIYPRKITDLFKGTQLTLIGRYRDGANAVTLTLRGKQGRENKSYSYSNLTFADRAEQNDFLPRLWATRRVGWLVEQIRANGEQRELRDEIVELGTRYGIVTPYTSYLATDGSERKDLSATSGGNRIIGGAGALREKARKVPSPTSMSATSGADAVALSKQQKAQQEVVTVTSDDESIYIANDVAKQIGAKTFYQQSNSVWQDADFKPESKLPEVKVQFASEDYFNLIKQEKELAQYFALGEEVVVVYKGKVYRVVK